MNESTRIGVVTISDRVHRGEYEDLGGPAVEAYVRRRFKNIDLVTRRIPDARDQIETTIIELCDETSCDLVITTGGTGPAPRDVTPEATVAVCDKMMPGFGEQMRRVSMQTVPTAILSRAVAGIRGRSFILNLPGKPGAIDVCMDAVIDALPYAIKLAGGRKPERT